MNLEFEFVYHEKQEASLCGVHCLNSLLQGQFFSPVELMEIAMDFDRTETQIMSEMGTDTNHFLKYMAEDSGNVADDGNYSVQVLEIALKVWNLNLLSLSSTEGRRVQSNPLQEQGFICNLQSHWFSVRKIGSHWFNLNSLLSAPEHISEFYLSLYLETLIQQGYSIFIVRGTFPPPIDHPLAEAENIFGTLNNSIIQEITHNLMNEKQMNRWHVVWIKNRNTSFQKKEEQVRTGRRLLDEEDYELQNGIKMSLSQPDNQQIQHQENEKKRVREESNNTCQNINVIEEEEDDEEEDLRLAIQLSRNEDNERKEKIQETQQQSEKQREVEMETHPELVTKIVFRFQDGSRTQKSFLKTDPLQRVFEFIESNQNIKRSEYRLLSNAPVVFYEKEKSNQTLSSLSLFPSCLLIVEKKSK